MERELENWLAQRSSEFDDEPGSSESGNNQEAPPYPLEPGPNIIRPEFDDPDSVQPSQPEVRPQVDEDNPSQPVQEELNFSSVEGIWLYSVYALPSPDYLIERKHVEITNSGSDTIFYVCDDCDSYQLPENFFASKTPQEKALIADFKNI